MVVRRGSYLFTSTRIELLNFERISCRSTLSENPLDLTWKSEEFTRKIFDSFCLREKYFSFPFFRSPLKNFSFSLFLSSVYFFAQFFFSFLSSFLRRIHASHRRFYQRDNRRAEIKYL